MNKYGLPEDKLKHIRMRDKKCVYCGKLMKEPKEGGFRGDWATIEHLNYLPPWNNPMTVAICCGSCNSSRGEKPLLVWFNSAYCKAKNISLNSVQKPVREYINANLNEVATVLK
jgi:hypothetical protein